MDATAKRRAQALPARATASIAAAFVAGCYGYGSYAQPAPDTPEVPLDQAGRGEKVFAEACAGCHGEHGEGSDGRPAVLGDGALPVSPPEGAEVRKTELKTAKDLFDFIKSDMPPIAPGSLSDNETWAVVALYLKSAGLAPPGADVGPWNAPSLKLHR